MQSGAWSLSDSKSHRLWIKTVLCYANFLFFDLT